MRARKLYKRIHGVECILAQCTRCTRLNYCEQHGTTAKCSCAPEETEHIGIPYQCRDASGLLVIRQPLLEHEK